MLRAPRRAGNRLAWRPVDGRAPARLHVRLLLSGRDYHALHRENGAFRFDPELAAGRVVWRPYPGLPPIVTLSNGAYVHAPEWYRNFLYDEERARGLDAVEDLASPGVLGFDLAAGEATLVLATDPAADADVAALRAEEHKRRAQFPSCLHRSAGAYLVDRGAAGRSSPAIRGSRTGGATRSSRCAASASPPGGSTTRATSSSSGARHVSDGMMPNRFPDHGEVPEYDSVDAALWYVVAAHEYLEAALARGRRVPKADRKVLDDAIEAILDGHARGTRHGIHADDDGLLAAGVPGLQLTWMDAKVGDWVVTPRIGKPVEVQALWLNAPRVGAARSERWAALCAPAQAAFEGRFWNELLGCLHDVVDPNHEKGTVNGGLRPEPDPRRRRHPLPRARGREGAPGRRHRRLGHVSEIVDAEPPHAPRGCPFQAWSVGEALGSRT